MMSIYIISQPGDILRLTALQLKQVSHSSVVFLWENEGLWGILDQTILTNGAQETHMAGLLQDHTLRGSVPRALGVLRWDQVTPISAVQVRALFPEVIAEQKWFSPNTLYLLRSTGPMPLEISSS